MAIQALPEGTQLRSSNQICSVFQALSPGLGFACLAQRHLLSHPQALPVSQKVWGCLFKGAAFLQFPEKCPARTYSSLEKPLVISQKFTSSPSVLMKSTWYSLKNDQVTLFTYFVPRCICIVYPWFYIFLQSKFPKTEKQIPICGLLVSDNWKENMFGKSRKVL